MSKSAYDIGYDDGYNGKERRDKDSFADMLLDAALPGLSGALDDFDYDKYNEGYDDGRAAAE